MNPDRPDRLPNPSQSSDIVRLLKRQWPIILLMVVLTGGAAFAFSVRQDKVYESTAALRYRDVSEDLSLLRGESFINRTPAERAAVAAESIESGGVLEPVVAELRPAIKDLDEAEEDISAEVETDTNLVIVTAKADDAELSARFANAVARSARKSETDLRRGRLDTTINSLRTELAAIPRARVGSSVEQGERAVLRTQIAQLTAARDSTNPVEIVRNADVPDGPSSPKTALNTAIGLVIGLLLGAALASFRQSRDRRLHSVDELLTELDHPIVGSVPSQTLGRVAPEEGKPITVDEDELEAFRVLRANLDFLDIDAELKVVLVTSALPEEGKSTVAASLAAAMAIAGRRTLLVECDLRRSVLSKRTRVESSPGLSDFLVGRAEASEVLRSVPAARAADQSSEARYTLIPAGGTKVGPAELLGSKRFADFLDQVREVYDVILIDSCPLLSVVDTRELIPRADAVLLCVRIDRTTRDQARAAGETLAKLPSRPTGIVITGMRAGRESHYGYYSYAYGYASTS